VDKRATGANRSPFLWRELALQHRLLTKDWVRENMSDDFSNPSGSLFHHVPFKDGCGAVARRRVPN